MKRCFSKVFYSKQKFYKMYVVQIISLHVYAPRNTDTKKYTKTYPVRKQVFGEYIFS